MAKRTVKKETETETKKVTKSYFNSETTLFVKETTRGYYDSCGKRITHTGDARQYQGGGWYQSYAEWN